MNGHNRLHRRRAFFTCEVICAIGILGFISVMAIDAIAGYYRIRDQYAWRQAAAWAAAGQLQRYQAGAPIDSPPPANLWPEKLRLQTAVTPGAGDWAGFDRVTVTATVELPHRQTAREQISGYVRNALGRTSQTTKPQASKDALPRKQQTALVLRRGSGS